jgi:hypothetical protein
MQKPSNNTPQSNGILFQHVTINDVVASAVPEQPVITMPYLGFGGGDGGGEGLGGEL